MRGGYRHHALAKGLRPVRSPARGDPGGTPCSPGQLNAKKILCPFQHCSIGAIRICRVISRTFLILSID